MENLNYLRFVAFDNDFDTDDRAWVPEVWAAHTLMLLEENMVIGRLVYTDFSSEIASFGDTVNTRKPGIFTAKRKGVNDDVTVQNATATKVPVVLNQHVHTSFMIRDGEESRSLADLIKGYLKPAAVSMARHVDKILLGQVYQYLNNCVGDLGQMNATTGDAHNAKNLILDARKAMDENNCPDEGGRVLILSPSSETDALRLDLFISAEQVGDNGTALRKASLGEKLGFQCFKCQNVPSVTDTGIVDTDDIAAAAAGATTVVSDGAAGAGYVVGQYIYFVDGTTSQDRMPYRITAINTDTLTLNRPLRVALANNSDVYLVPMASVALAEHTAAGGPSAYPAGYTKEIWVDGTGVPTIGQLCSFNNAATPLTDEYCIIDVVDMTTAYAITLDRPLEAAIANNYTVGLGPGGEYNFAFLREALALVVRPLALPRAGAGAIAGVSNYNDLSMRVTITYDGEKQGHLITLDMLCGVKVLDEDQGVVLIG